MAVLGLGLEKNRGVCMHFCRVWRLFFTVAHFGQGWSNHVFGIDRVGRTLAGWRASRGRSEEARRQAGTADRERGSSYRISPPLCVSS